MPSCRVPWKNMVRIYSVCILDLIEVIRISIVFVCIVFVRLPEVVSDQGSRYPDSPGVE